MIIKEFLEIAIEEAQPIAVWDYSLEENKNLIFSGYSDNIPEEYLDYTIENWNYYNCDIFGNVICVNIESIKEE